MRQNTLAPARSIRINESVIDKLIGHESGGVQSRYAHAAMPTLVIAVARLDWSPLGFATRA